MNSQSEREPFPLLVLGGFKVRPYGCTPAARALVRRFWDRLSILPFCAPPDGGETWHLAVVGPLVPDERAYPFWLSTEERRVCARFHRAWAAICAQGMKPKKHNLVSWPELWSGGVLDGALDGTPQIALRADRDVPRQFFCFLDDEDDGPPPAVVFIHSLFLAGWWHALRGGLCLHSSAVARGDSGFLFLGPSGAGKTTVARLGVAAGQPVLGDDLNFVIPDEEGGYLLAAAPSARLLPGAYAALRPPLRGMFLLVQDRDDYLAPVPPRRAARALFDGLTQIPVSRRLPDGALRAAYGTACALARRAPCYELHFRQGPGFWALIDEQFPG